MLKLIETEMLVVEEMIKSLDIEQDSREKLFKSIVKLVVRIGEGYHEIMQNHMHEIRKTTTVLEDIRLNVACIEFDRYAIKKENEKLKRELGESR